MEQTALKGIPEFLPICGSFLFFLVFVVDVAFFPDDIVQFLEDCDDLQDGQNLIIEDSFCGQLSILSFFRFGDLLDVGVVVRFASDLEIFQPVFEQIDQETWIQLLVKGLVIAVIVALEVAQDNLHTFLVYFINGVHVILETPLAHFVPFAKQSRQRTQIFKET